METKILQESRELGTEPLIEVRFKITRSQRKYIRLHQYMGDHRDKHEAIRNILQRYMDEHPMVYQKG